MTQLQAWLREASNNDTIDSLVQRCHVAANRIDALEADVKKLLEGRPLITKPIKAPIVQHLDFRKILRWK